MLLEIENVFVTPAGEVCADAAGQRSRQGAEEPQQPESVSGNASFTSQKAEHSCWNFNRLQCVSVASLLHML